MNIQLLSDLHLESNPGFMPTPAPATSVRGRFLWYELMTTDTAAAKVSAGSGLFQ